MIRTIGILCGSALAIGFLIVVLGMPTLTPEDSPAIPSSPTELPPHDLVSASVTQVSDATARTARAETRQAALEPAMDDIAAAIVEPSVEALANPSDELADEDLPAATTGALVENWYAFWSPFRSELAANGFIEQLQRSTGIDYRVVRLKPGVYEVAFAYDNPEDISTNLATISRATGLDMPDG